MYNMCRPKWQLYCRKLFLLLLPWKSTKIKQKNVFTVTGETFVFSSRSGILWMSFPKHNKPEDILCLCYSGSHEESIGFCVCLAKYTTLCGKEQFSDQKTTVVATLCWESNLKWTSDKWNLTGNYTKMSLKMISWILLLEYGLTVLI